jgi:type IV secretory pathway VirB2 component (pilin)
MEPTDYSAGSSSIVEAIVWIEGVMTGSVATAIAVLAVAAFGLRMLGGHVDWRHGSRIVLGCFLIFGAPAIARGFLTAAGNSTAYPPLSDSSWSPLLTITSPAQRPSGE